MANPIWTVDGVAMPRNPDSYDVKWDNANVTYAVMADGSQVRVGAPKLISGADLMLTWKNADRRLLNFIMPFFNPTNPVGSTRSLVMGGIQPPMKARVYFDTPQKTMSQDIVEKRFGEGGTRHDLNLKLRMDSPYLLSTNAIPNTTPTAAQVKSWFGGHLGNALDGIPVWNGNGWVFTASGANTIQNLGTAPWSPVIKFTGPFTAMSMDFQYSDVDGTGLWTRLVWTGPALVAGSYLLFDTGQKRMYSVVGGVKTEVYTFVFSTISDGVSFSYVPPMNPGVNNYSWAVAGNTAATTVDFSNAGTENFRYW